MVDHLMDQNFFVLAFLRTVVVVVVVVVVGGWLSGGWWRPSVESWARCLTEMVGLSCVATSTRTVLALLCLVPQAIFVASL